MLYDGERTNGVELIDKDSYWMCISCRELHCEIAHLLFQYHAEDRSELALGQKIVWNSQEHVGLTDFIGSYHQGIVSEDILDFLEGKAGQASGHRTAHVLEAFAALPGELLQEEPGNAVIIKAFTGLGKQRRDIACEQLQDSIYHGLLMLEAKRKKA